MNRTYPQIARATGTFVSLPTRPFVLVAALATVLLIFSDFLLRFTWIHFSGPINAGLFFTLDALYGPGIFLQYSAQDALQIIHHNFALRITRACSGLDGWFLFTLAALLVWAWERNRYSRRGWTLFFVGGLLVVHLLNVGRIALLFELNELAYGGTGSAFNLSLVRDLIHPHLGMALYLVGLIAYCTAADRFILRRRRYRLTGLAAIPTLFDT